MLNSEKRKPNRMLNHLGSVAVILIVISVLFFAPWVLLVLVTGHMFLGGFIGKGEGRSGQYGRYDGGE
jgi:hypothetical protein